MTRPRPPIAPCPRVEWSNRHGCYIVFLPVNLSAGIAKGKRQNRRDSAEAERRGAMAAVRWLAKNWNPPIAHRLKVAIDRGEVLPAARKGKRR